MRTRAAHVILTALALAACSPVPAVPAPTQATASGTWWPPRTYTADPAVHGRVDAEDAIARGRPLRLLRGELYDQRIDADTGLPVTGYGCCFEEANESYLVAYNAVIDAALAAGQLREFDFRPKLLSAEAARARMQSAGRVFAPGDPPIASPTAPHRVVLVGGTDDSNECILYAERSDGSGRWALRGSHGALRIAFGEDGTTLLTEGGGAPGIEVFDLPHAVSIQFVQESATATRRIDAGDPPPR